MSLIEESVRPQLIERHSWFGIVASEPTGLGDTLYVVLPDFDPRFKWECRRWQSRDSETLPVPGDECLVLLDNRRQPWVVAWVPVGS